VGADNFAFKAVLVYFWLFAFGSYAILPALNRLLADFVFCNK
jgi:hypothetical protein